MEHDKPAKEYSKSYSGDNRSHGRPRANFTCRVRHRGATRGMVRNEINIRGAALNFRHFNHPYTMPPPPDGNFASFGKSNQANEMLNYGTMPQPMKLIGDNFTSLSDDRNDSKCLQNLPQAPKQDSISSVTSPVTPSVNDGKGGFGRGRHGPPVMVRQFALSQAPRPLTVRQFALSQAARPLTIRQFRLAQAVNAAPMIDSSVVSKVDSTLAPKEHRSKSGSDQSSVQICKSETATNDFKTNRNENMKELGFKKRLSFGDYEIEISAKKDSIYTNSVFRTWNETGFSEEMQSHITEKLEYNKPTTIQSAIIPLLTGYVDVIFQSVTGSGKLTAIVLSVLEVLKKDTIGKSTKKDCILQPRCVIISPTSKVMKDTYKLCLKLVGDLNFTVLRTFSEKEESNYTFYECDILCSNLDDLNRYLKSSLLSFDKVAVIAIEQAERIEQNFLNLVRFLRQASVSTNQRQTIISGTCISPKIYEWAAYIFRENFLYVQMNRKAQNYEQHRYTKEDLMKVSEAIGDKKPDIQCDDMAIAKQDSIDISSVLNEDFNKRNENADSTNKVKNLRDESNIQGDKSDNSAVPSEAASTEIDQSQEIERDSDASQMLDENSSVTASQNSDLPEEKRATLEEARIKLSNMTKTDFQASSTIRTSILPSNVVRENTLHKQKDNSPVSQETIMPGSLMGVSCNKMLALNSKMGSLGSSCKTTSSSELNCSNTDLESIFRDMKNQIELETLKTKNELLQADNTRLTKRVISLEQQLGSVMKFFGNFLASNTSTVESGILGGIMLERYGDLDRY